jgi:hypothetical protein
VGKWARAYIPWDNLPNIEGFPLISENVFPPSTEPALRQFFLCLSPCPALQIGNQGPPPGGLFCWDLDSRATEELRPVGRDADIHNIIMGAELLV